MLRAAVRLRVVDVEEHDGGESHGVVDDGDEEESCEERGE